MGLVMYAIPFFILAMALEFAYGVVVGRNTYRLADTISSLQLGTLSRLQGLLGLGMGGAAYQAVAEHFSVPHWSTDAIAVWIFAFVAYDFCYYWSHRLGHEWKLFWASHVAHHQSEEFNLSTALRQTSTGYLNFVFYLPLFLIGLPPTVFATVGALNLIYQFWVHTEHIDRLGPLERVLVTPSNHRVHHARNPRYIDRNYGGVFIVWDRMFGTFEDERRDEPCVYGITRPLTSWNPLWANVHVWLETLRVSLATKRWRDKIKVWFTGPGWFPADVTPASHGRTTPKFAPHASRLARGYTFVQYWAVTAAALALIVTAASFDRPFVLTTLGLLAFSFYVQGASLEGRPYAGRLEALRLALLGAHIAANAVTLGALTPWLAAYVLASVVAAGLAAARGSFASGAAPDAAMR
jgi:sterol desaturase/sphingolipid hydroxylase (fatty acid hydroxylase superfamily)